MNPGSFALLGSACAATPLPDGERRVALQQATDQVILPTYRELDERTRELSVLLDELHEAPESAELDVVRQAFFEARRPLGESQAFGFGPATDLHSTAAIDQSPLDASKLDAELAGDAELTPAHLRTLGANKRGLHAIEYLLFPADDEQLSAALLADSALPGRRLEAHLQPDRGRGVRAFTELHARLGVLGARQVRRRDGRGRR